MTRQLEKLFAYKYFFPILLVLVAVMAFGLFLQQQGFYWDDWPVVLMAKQADLSFLQDFYSYDRPFSFWTYQLTLPVLGTSPQAWQIFTLLVRTLCAWLVWRVLLTIWPARRFTAAGAALLFLVYPSFTQQNISLAYSQHFIALALYFFSILAMLFSLNSKRRLAWIMAAVAAQVVHLGTLEYFAGLELLRPLMLYLYVRERWVRPTKARREALREWAPYAVVLLIFAVWRVFFLNLPEDPNSPQLFAELLTNFPIALLGFVERSLRDFVQIVFGPWANTMYSELIDFSNLSRLVSIGVAIGTGYIVSQYLRWAARRSKPDTKSESWGAQAVVLGLAGIFLGMLPVRIADRDLLTGLFSDRFTLPALFGAALLWVGLARTSLKGSWHRALLVGVLVGVSVGFHFRTSNNYNWDSTRQQRIFWQMHWRMPKLPDGVALVGDGALSVYTNEYAAAAAVNTLYRSAIGSGVAPLWVLDFYDDFDVLNEAVFVKNDIHAIRNLEFEVDESKVILFDYSTPGQCLWILDAEDEWNLDVEPEMRDVARVSRVELIEATPEVTPYADVFGSTPALDWCYYYQKIELTAQLAEWDKAASLWHEATQKGFRTNNQYEMFPVIEALARTGDLEAANALSLEAVRKQQNVKRAMCELWSGLQDIDINVPEELSC